MLFYGIFLNQVPARCCCQDRNELNVAEKAIVFKANDRGFKSSDFG